MHQALMATIVKTANSFLWNTHTHNEPTAITQCIPTYTKPSLHIYTTITFTIRSIVICCKIHFKIKKKIMSPLLTPS